MKCECGNDRFYATQTVYVDREGVDNRDIQSLDVIVSGDNIFLENVDCDIDGISDAENPDGPYTCTTCGLEYENLNQEPYEVITNMKGQNNMSKEDGFDRNKFMMYLEKSFNGFESPFLRGTVNNLVDYGLKHERISKDQFCYWLSDILPEVEFGEIAAFMDDGSLTKNGQEEKRKYLQKTIV